MIINPDVALSLTRPRPGTIYLEGEVMKPGMFQINNTNTQLSGMNTQGSDPISRVDLRVGNILAVAGGVMVDADLNHVEVRHAKTCQTETINLWNILKGSSHADDLLVQSGDTIYVPKAQTINLSDEDYKMLLRSSIGPQSFPVRVIGEARMPGLYQIDGTSPYLSSALVKANGFMPQASRTQVGIRRFTSDNTYKDFTVKINDRDFVLHPNDVVVIGENRFFLAGRFAQQIAAILSPFVSISEIGAASAQIYGFGGWSKTQTTITKSVNVPNN